jgi:MSHA pilin protein MshC
MNSNLGNACVNGKMDAYNLNALDATSRLHGSCPIAYGIKGFTLIELIMVIIIIGIMAVSAMPHFADRSMFESRGFHDETLSLLRYAQKTAIAQRRTVCVSLGASGVALTIDTDTPADGVCNNTTPSLPNTPRGGSGLTGSVASFRFTSLGSTDQSANVTITITGTTNITVEAVTGYVHE